jgi:pimeloyl-ACP methyl ester carboxylesterase
MEFNSDGVRLHYELHGPDTGSPMVLVHGYASDYQLNWVGTRWQEALTRAGHRVVGLDCRGHGQSDKPHDVESYSLTVMAADVQRLLDHLDIQTARYVGYSMGARIGLEAVLDFPDRIERAVLGGVGMFGAVDGAEQIARAMRGGAPENDVAASFYKFASARPTNDLEALAACILGLRGRLDVERLAKIATPILVVVGERDNIASDAAELVEHLPTARLVTVAGRDHMGTVPAREFKEAALEFLGEP